MAADTYDITYENRRVLHGISPELKRAIANDHVEILDFSQDIDTREYRAHLNAHCSGVVTLTEAEVVKCETEEQLDNLVIERLSSAFQCFAKFVEAKGQEWQGG